MKKGHVLARYHKATEKELKMAIIRGAFEYQGQKCSAASRAYIPSSIWPSLQEKLLDAVSKIKVGDVREFYTFKNKFGE